MSETASRQSRSTSVGFDVAIVGGGYREYRQLTLEACYALATSRVIYTPRRATSVLQFFRRFGAEVRLFNDFLPGAFRPPFYEQMATEVVEEAARGPGVALVEQGSATLANAVTRGVILRARAHGLRVKVISGVSAVEGINTRFGLDAAQYGLQVLQAQNMMLFQRRLDSSCACMILQPALYNTLAWEPKLKEPAQQFIDLQKYLLAFYNGATLIALVDLARPATDGGVIWLRLMDLVNEAERVEPHHTLFIPPATQPAQDHEFGARLLPDIAKSATRSRVTVGYTPHPDDVGTLSSLLMEFLQPLLSKRHQPNPSPPNARKWSIDRIHAASRRR